MTVINQREAAIEALFAKCWPWLERSLQRGRQRGLAREDLLELLLANRATLWPGDGGALVTQLIESDRGRSCHVWLGGGELRSLLEMRPAIEAWARAQGADHASIEGRRGWDRLFRPFGYARQGSELVKAL